MCKYYDILKVRRVLLNAMRLKRKAEYFSSNKAASVTRDCRAGQYSNLRSICHVLNESALKSHC